MPDLTYEALGPFASEIHSHKYPLTPDEDWGGTAIRTVTNVLGALNYDPRSEEVRELIRLVAQRKFMPGGRYLYSAGRDFHQVNNCLLMRAEDSREGWADLSYKASMSLMTGAGIGVVYSDIRRRGSRIARTGGVASGPVSLMHVINEAGRQYQQGGSRRSAIWAGLNWRHDDIFEFIQVKNWSKELRALKEKDHDTWMPMELTNISVGLDDLFFEAYGNPEHPEHGLAQAVYWATIERALKTGEPGFSIDTGRNAGEELRNACTEVTSADDSDVCNLGSINLARIESKGELAQVVELATLFLIAGTVYSHVPYEKVKDVRAKNRRLGLGLMGVHEWLLQRGKPYGPDEELGEWLDVYAASTLAAGDWAEEHCLSAPVKTRAIAPNGTIGIIAETTTGIEPLFCAAYERRYLVGNAWAAQYVIDPVAQRLVDQGVDPDSIEDAYGLANDVERRVGFQHWLQQYVDHGISSTVNLPAPVTDEAHIEDFGKMLIGYLPGLRGMTVYPNGARSGQPIVAVPMSEAYAAHAVVEGNEESCIGGVCAV